MPSVRSGTRCSALLALVVAGCAAGGSGTNNMGGDDPFATAQGKAVKVTYVRFNWDPRGKRWLHEYRIMLSDGWRQKNGQNPREPFTKLWKDAFRAESIPDSIMQQLVGEMVKFGLNDLRDTTADTVNLEELKKVEKLAYQQSDIVNRWRIINIETDDGLKKTVAAYDNDDRVGRPGRGELWEKFFKVELQVIKVANAYTVQVTYDKPPMVPK